MEPLAALANRKMILPSTREDYLIVEKAYLIDLFRPVVSRIVVDVDWYSGKYPDVRSAIGAGVIPDAAEHYIQYGYYEHRMPYAIVVDEEWYLAQYEDVSEAVRNRVFTSGQGHFEERGYQEGRVPYPNFTLKTKDKEKK
jgi:hypothetical protein